MKLIIAGSRGVLLNQATLTNMVTTLPFSQEIREIVSGGACGIDSLAITCYTNGPYKLTVMEADWNTYGKVAGILRNAAMAKYADALLAVWDGSSPGTKHMIDIAKEHNLKLKVYEVDNE